MAPADTERSTLERRVDALERAFAALADKEPKSPVPYETYKALADEMADFRIALASTEKGWRRIGAAGAGLFLFLSGIATNLFGEWAKAHWWSGK